jgi:hypothetical protein
MNLPPLSRSGFERVLHYLLNARGMDADDAMDWIENHYDVHDTNDQAKRGDFV